MAERNVGAAVVLDPESPGPGILTERDILQSVAAGRGPPTELVGDHLTEEPIFASPEWSLEQAAESDGRARFPPPAGGRTAATSRASSRCATSSAAGRTPTRRSLGLESPSDSVGSSRRSVGSALDLLADVLTQRTTAMKVISPPAADEPART